MGVPSGRDHRRRLLSPLQEQRVWSSGDQLQQLMSPEWPCSSHSNTTLWPAMPARFLSNSSEWDCKFHPMGTELKLRKVINRISGHV